MYLNAENIDHSTSRNMELIRVSRQTVDGGPSIWTLSFIYTDSAVAKALRGKVKQDVKFEGRPPSLNITGFIKPKLAEQPFPDATFLGKIEFKFSSLYLYREGAVPSQSGQPLLEVLSIFTPGFVVDERGFVRLVLNDFLKLE